MLRIALALAVALGASLSLGGCNQERNESVRLMNEGIKLYRKERLMQAYFVDGSNVGDPDVVADCAADVGFDREAAVRFLASDAGTDEVAERLAEAADRGVTAVPTYVLDGAWAIPGAQEPETFAAVIGKLAAKVSGTRDG